MLYDIRSTKRGCNIAKSVTGVRLSDAERKKLQDEANELGISLSEYMRLKLANPPQLDRIEKKLDAIAVEIAEKK